MLRVKCACNDTVLSVLSLKDTGSRSLYGSAACKCVGLKDTVMKMRRSCSREPESWSAVEI
jgi:hypothetical protein